MSDKIKLGITIGDINGIGPEVIIKALSDSRVLKQFTPIIYGSSRILSYHKNTIERSRFSYMAIQSLKNTAFNKVNVVNCWEEMIEVELGRATEASGKCAHIALDRAVNDMKAGLIDGLVTAPINKHAMSLTNFNHPGHTEYLSKALNAKGSLMMMCSEKLKIALVTNHLPVHAIPKYITKENISTKLEILNETLIRDFGIEKPVIGVLGLNPHAGDNGAIGKEDEEIVKPVITEAKKKGMLVMGPFAADGFFGSSQFRKVDAVLAMYHDQGLIPFKALTFGSGTNFTAGLSHIRTSPDHGTGYDIAGQDKADPASMRMALFTALDLIRSRSEYKKNRENVLVKQPKHAERE